MKTKKRYVEDIFNGLKKLGIKNIEAEWLIVDYKTFSHMKYIFNTDIFIPKEDISPKYPKIDRILGLKIACVDTPATIFEIK